MCLLHAITLLVTCHRRFHVIRHLAIEQTKDSSRRKKKYSRGCGAKIIYSRRTKDAPTTVVTPLPCDSLIESFTRAVLRAKRTCFYTQMQPRGLVSQQRRECLLALNKYNVRYTLILRQLQRFVTQVLQISL